MSVARQKARAFGLALEWRAAAWLMLKGYRILARNHGAQGGELDIVALSPERWIGRATLCIVEVRGRIDANEARASVDGDKRLRIERAAQDFLRRNPPYRALPIRFDIMAAGRTGALVHTRDAFDA